MKKTGSRFRTVVLSFTLVFVLISVQSGLSGCAASGERVAANESSGALVASAVYMVNSEPIAYTVTFVDGFGSVLSTQQVALGQVPTQPTNPSHSGYEFAGWLPSPGSVSGPTTYTALWTPVEPPPQIVFSNPDVDATNVVVTPGPSPTITVPQTSVTNTSTGTTDTGTASTDTTGAGTTTIDDPLAATTDTTDTTERYSLVNLMLAVLALSGAFLVGMLFFSKRRDYDAQGLYVATKVEGTKGLVSFIFTIALAIAAIAVFALTEDLSLPVGLIDDMTPIMASIIVVQLVTLGTFLYVRYTREFQSTSAQV